MTINIRQKGQNGEREIINELEPIVTSVRMAVGLPITADNILQRNQNQSAVGGSDISNPFGLAIEVKRQENLSINSWWAQCIASAEAAKEIPILLFRQNKQKWRCMTVAALWLQGSENSTGSFMHCRAEISFEDFKSWFREHVTRKYKV